MAKLEFVGTIHSELKNLSDCPLQETENAPEAIVEIFANYAEGAKNIKPGDYLIHLAA